MSTAASGVIVDIPITRIQPSVNASQVRALLANLATLKILLPEESRDLTVVLIPAVTEQIVFLATRAISLMAGRISQTDQNAMMDLLRRGHGMPPERS